MSETAEHFISHLGRLHEHDRAALAVLRRSLAHAPGSWPAAYPYVERFAVVGRPAQDAWRIALYVVAALYARHPVHDTRRSMAEALAQLRRVRDSDSLEQRFVSLLSSDAEGLPQHLRQGIALLATADIGLDYVQLLDDMARWLNPFNQESRDRLRQSWARDYYRALVSEPIVAHSAAP